jgi:hypothetical protein
MGTLHDDLCTFMIISHWILLKMRNISDKSCRENQNTHLLFTNFFSESHVIYEIMCKNVVQLERPQMTIWRMRFACWITKATNTHSKYLILIAFPHQRSLCECTSMLCYKYIACLVYIPFLIADTFQTLFCFQNLQTAAD